MGTRELVWLAIGLLVAYIAFELWRAARAGRAAPTPAAAGEGFQNELEVARLSRELEQLRGELGEQRQVLAEQRRQIDELANSLQEQKVQQEAVAASHGVSPEYDEALVFARRGLDVEAIAERCGITVAEAELVCALARRGGSGAGT